MDKTIEYAIDKSIERVFQSWFIDSNERYKLIVETHDYIERIYDIIKREPSRKFQKTTELMKLVGLDYGKVYKKSKRMSYHTLEEGVHDSLTYFLDSLL